jgi:hypothetical protein
MPTFLDMPSNRAPHDNAPPCPGCAVAAIALANAYMTILALVFAIVVLAWRR